MSASRIFRRSRRRPLALSTLRPKSRRGIPGAPPRAKCARPVLFACSATVTTAMNPLWPALPAVLLLVAVAAIRRSRSQRLARIRATWGAPIERARRMDAMSTSHVARIAVLGGGRSLDERTWADLNLDDVFAAIDRTQSTLGQHALYHRLRTAPVAEHLGAFEALVRPNDPRPGQLGNARKWRSRVSRIHTGTTSGGSRRRRCRATPLVHRVSGPHRGRHRIGCAGAVLVCRRHAARGRAAAQRGGSLRNGFSDRHDRAQLQAMRSPDCDGRVVAVSRRRRHRSDRRPPSDGRSARSPD